MTVSRVRVAFRPALPVDAGPLVSLVEAAYRGDAGWTSESDLLWGPRTDRAAVARATMDPCGAVLVAEFEASIVACCHVRVVDGTGQVDLLAVQPGRQRLGIGTAVLDQAERLLRRRWAPVRLQGRVLMQRPELIAWMDRRGYRPAGRPAAYCDDGYGIPLRSDLTRGDFVKTTGI